MVQGADERQQSFDCIEPRKTQGPVTHVHYKLATLELTSLSLVTAVKQRA
jgi:hypothetical protein